MESPKFTIAYPLKGGPIRFNQKFAENFNSSYAGLGLKGHDGLDFYATDGTPVYAAHDGRVYFAGYDSAKGLGIKIRTEETHDYEGKQVYMASIYWHLKTSSLLVTASQQVKKGDLIAMADNTGNSTGSHLHFGLYPMIRPTPWDFTVLDYDNGYHGAIDPMPYFETTTIHYQFVNDLYLTVSNNDVKVLQDILKEENVMSPLVPSTGYFGLLTKAAVIRLQLKYAHDILTPVNLISPTGYVGPSTRAFINNKYK